ncbi:MAG: heat-inducible transcription repressor HrcA [Clostridiales bacterium]|nr:heat-inducible transcription repressor HrcA [Clostridiales bacterium]
MSYGRNTDKSRMSERKKQILKAIIEAHIEFGEPIGSKYLTSGGGIACSSATIRNEMSELEDMGYLEQPHTSSGRVPSEAGYRLYVDSLIDSYRLTQNEIDELKANLRGKQAELDTILEKAVHLASRLTDYTALTVKPPQRRVTVSRFEILPIDEHALVLVMLIGSSAKTKYIQSRYPLTKAAVIGLSTVLNTYISGLTSSEITLPILMEMERSMGEYEYLVSPVVKAVCEIISSYDGGELKFDGINRLLSYPDFYDIDRLRDMLDLFERKDDLLSAFSERTFYSESEPDNKVKIYIGRENSVKIMDNSSLIFKTVKKDGIPVGAIGIIGPTRMNYRRAIALIDHLSDRVSGMITDGADSE